MQLTAAGTVIFRCVGGKRPSVSRGLAFLSPSYHGAVRSSNRLGGLVRDQTSQH